MKQIAAPLLALFPDQEQALATPLLVEVILPAELRGLDTHPKPERYTEIVVGALGDELREQPAELRLDTLRMQAARARMRQMSATALALGVARYLLANPQASAKAGHWLSPQAQSWVAQGQGAVVLEAVEQLNGLERWGAETQVVFPALYDAEKGNFVQTRLTLQSVVSGSFETTGGPMADFVRAVGGQAETLRLGE